MSAHTRTWGSRYAIIDVPSPDDTAPSSPSERTPGTTPSPVVSNLGGRKDATATVETEQVQHTRNKNGPGRNGDGSRMDNGPGIRAKDYAEGRPPQYYYQRRGPPDLRANHEASVFVASLPGYLSDLELKTELEDVLIGLNNLRTAGDGAEQQSHNHSGQAYPPLIEVLSIKVVRDNSKSGVCAFVQVGSADQALYIVEYTAPHPLALRGTFLRLERAKAYRALRLTFDEGFPEAGFLKLTRHKASRFISIALLDSTGETLSSSIPNPHQHDSAESTLSIPVTLPKEEILVRVIEFFGPVEALYQEDVHPAVAAGEQASDSSRPWVVKWKFRNDCVSAFYALPQIKGLRVMWAHIPPERFVFDKASPRRSSIGNDSGESLNAQSDSRRGSLLSKDFKTLEINDRDWPELSPLKSEFDHSQGAPTKVQSLLAFLPDGQSSNEKECMPSLGSEADIASLPFSPSAPHVNLPVVTRTQKHSTESAVEQVVPRAVSVPASPESVPTTHTSSGTMTRTEPGNPLPTVPVESLVRTPTSTPYRDSTTGVDPRSIFVGGLDSSVDWTSGLLSEIFTPYGAVEDIKVFPINVYRSSGFAFVRFVTGEAAQKAAIGEDKRVFDGCVLKVQMRNVNGRNRPFFRRQQDGPHERTASGRREDANKGPLPQQQGDWSGNSSSPLEPPHPIGTENLPQTGQHPQYVPRYGESQGPRRRPRHFSNGPNNGLSEGREGRVGDQQRWIGPGNPNGPDMSSPLSVHPVQPPFTPVRSGGQSATDSPARKQYPLTPISPTQMEGPQSVPFSAMSPSPYAVAPGVGWYYYPYNTPYMWPGAGTPQEGNAPWPAQHPAGAAQTGQQWSYMPWSMGQQPVYPSFPITPPVNPDSPLPQDRAGEENTTAATQSSSTLRPTGFVQSDNILIPIYPQGSLDRYLAENPAAADPRRFMPGPYPPGPTWNGPSSSSLQQMPHVVPRTPTKGFPREMSGANESGTINVTAAQIFNPGSAFLPPNAVPMHYNGPGYSFAYPGGPPAY